MERTGSYVSLSRSKLGPDPDVPHSVRAVQADGAKSVATCRCGWRTGRRRTPWIARQALDAHIAQAADTAREAV